MSKYTGAEFTRLIAMAEPCEVVGKDGDVVMFAPGETLTLRDGVTIGHGVVLDFSRSALGVLVATNWDSGVTPCDNDPEE